jgi:hypothetical protein
MKGLDVGYYPVYEIKLAQAMPDSNFAIIGSLQENGVCTHTTLDAWKPSQDAGRASVRVVSNCNTPSYSQYISVMFLHN